MASTDKIHLLSESLCNLVRAQEVVSNPAAAVKELLDNAIDAGASKISLDIKKGGKEYIQVIDNGCGMSPIDARMAFERHATSKLRTAEDLEKIQTLGFRGEGLASIATVANVVMKTRREEDELGTEVIISGGNFTSQKPIVTPVGTSIRMNEVFFNVPGRRRSLKKDDAEERAVDLEFTQCVLAHPNISFLYYKSGELYKELTRGSLKERIIAVAGRNFSQKLLPINYESPNITISGFITPPDFAVQRLQKQFFFVNGRYIKHDYFRKAIEVAFEDLVPQGARPHFFIYFNVPTENVDINIHPSKKEVRFVDEKYIWELLKKLCTVALSNHAAIPMIDWDNPSTLEIPAYQGRSEIPRESNTPQATQASEVIARRVFFGGSTTSSRPSSHYSGMQTVNSHDIDWSNLANEFEKKSPISPPEQESLFANPSSALSLDNKGLPMSHGVFQGTDYPTTGLLIYKGKYIVSSLRRSLALIDLNRAHLRVLYDRFYTEILEQKLEVMQLMYPESIHFSLEELDYAHKAMAQLQDFGFVFEQQEGEDTFLLTQTPAIITNTCVDFVARIVQEYKDTESHSREQMAERLALDFAEIQAYPYGSKLDPQQVDDLLAKLFASSNTNIDPRGRTIISLLGEEEIERRF